MDVLISPYCFCGIVTNFFREMREIHAWWRATVFCASVRIFNLLKYSEDFDEVWNWEPEIKVVRQSKFWPYLLNCVNFKYNYSHQLSYS